MPRKYAQLHTDFSAGIMDSQVIMRSDVDAAYRHGAAEMTNWHVHVQGGLARRKGMRFDDEITHAPGESFVRLVPFEFDENEYYLFAFCTDAMRMYAPDPSGVMTLIDVEATFTPASIADLERLTWSQSGDVMWVCHPGTQPLKITRTSSTTFVVEEWDVAALPPDQYSDGGAAVPFWKFAPGEWRMQLTNLSAGGPTYPAGTTGNFKSLDGDYFQIEHVGYIFSLGVFVDSTTGEVSTPQIRVTSYTSPTEVAVVLLNTMTTSDKNVTTTDGFIDWGEQAWSEIRGYPRAVTLHSGRLWLASSPSLPSHIWGSWVGLFDQFHTVTGADDEAINAPLDTDKVNRIRHMVSARDLQVYTDQGEFYVQGTELEPITPSNFAIRRVSNYGCGNIAPKLFDQATMFIQRGETLARELIWNDLNQGYNANPISLLCENVVKNMTRMEVWYGGLDTQEEFTYAPKADGTMAVYHASRAQNISGWSLWQTQGSIVDVAVVNRVPYFVVLRDVDGELRWYLECLCTELLLDSALVLDADTPGTPQSVWTGLDHLEGRVVEATGSVLEGGEWRDNAYYLGEYTVTGGQIDISIPNDYAFERISVGLAYTSTVQTLPAELMVQEGSLTNRPKRLHSVTVHVDETMAFEVDGAELLARHVTDDMSQPPPLLTGPYRFYQLGVGLRRQFDITSTLPLPCDVLAFTQELAF